MIQNKERCKNRKGKQYYFQNKHYSIIQNEKNRKKGKITFFSQIVTGKNHKAFSSLNLSYNRIL